MLLRPGSHFFLTFFRWLEANRAERGPCQGRAVLARSSERTRRPLTRLPRSVHSPAKKWDHRFPSPPLLFSRCAFLLATCCCNLAASSCFTSLIWSSILSNASGASFSPAARGRNTLTSSKRTPTISASAGSRLSTSLALASTTSRHHSPSVRPLVCAAVSSCAYSSSLTLKPMDFLRSGGFTMSRLPLSPQLPRLAAALKNQQVRLR